MPWRKGNRLRTVGEDEADADTRRLYGEIKAALGFPGLQLYYPALGAYPAFLALHWRAVRQVAQSEELFRAAECLRAEAYTRMHNYFRVVDLQPCARAEADLARIADYYHWRNALLLLLFSFQIQAMEGATGRADAEITSHEHVSIIDKVPLVVAEHSAPAPVKKLYDDIRRTLQTPFVSPEFCAFAVDPEFLRAYWKALKPMTASPLYCECKHGVRSTAWGSAAQLPGPAELTLDTLAEAGLSPQDVASIARILELFVDSLSGQLLNLAAARIGLEGGNLTAEQPNPRSSGRTQPAA